LATVLVCSGQTINPNNIFVPDFWPCAFLLIMLFPVAGIYIIVNLFIDHYFKDIDYNIRLLLLAAGLLAFYGGIGLAF